MVFISGNEFIPLLENVDEDSDPSSDESTELVTEPLKDVKIQNMLLENQQNEDDTHQQNLFQSMNKFVDEEFETKLNLNDNKPHQTFETVDIEDDEAPLFSEIWKRPSESESDQNLDLSKEVEKPINEVSYGPPPGLTKDTSTSSKQAKNKKKNHGAMRMAYQKTAARSEEQAFNVNMRQPILIPNNKSSLIEEEAKSSSNLNLSTSSRSYRPGSSKPKTNIYSHHSATMSVSSTSNYTTPQYNSTNMPGRQNSQFYYQNAAQNAPMQMHPPGMIPTFPGKPIAEPIQKPYHPQYAYPVGMVPQQQMYPASQPQPAPQPKPQVSSFNPAVVKQASSGSVYNKPSNFGAEKPLEVNQEEVKNRHSANVPVPKAVISTDTSSNITSGSVSPPVGELRIGTGLLKFFNQQHQYGFIVSGKDGSDIFFHYDDVKHTQLSKEFLRHATENYDVTFSFQILDYIGKYESSKKAVNINLLSIIAKNTDNNLNC